MSLFKAREWWHARGGPNEEYDVGSLCVANIDNDPSGALKIITGSFNGNLRIYGVKERGYKAEDMLLEQELDQAILQLAAGRFSSHGGLHLAVLHPKKIAVFNVASPGPGYLQLTRLYEHGLDHTAANFTYGPFGGAPNQDYLCVQSYDGQLAIFECEGFAFARFLPNFLVPGPLAYCEQSDSFVTCNCAFELESYKYKMLAAATGEKPDAAGSGATGHHVAKRVAADWKLILGEMALDIRPGRITPGLQAYETNLVVLCEHHVFVVSSIGKLTFQKRLEYHPACGCVYPVPGAKGPGGPENLLVATHTRNLLVYRESTLVWAARTDTQPVALAVAELGGLKGLIVTLDDTGNVVVNYLGTDPMTTPVGLVEGKDLDYEAMAREHRSLAAVIREHSGTKRAEPPDRLVIRAHVPTRFDSGGGYGDGGRGGSRRLTIKLQLDYQGAAAGHSIDTVDLYIRTPDPVAAESPSVTLRGVGFDPTTPDIALVTLLPGNGCLPASCTATVVAQFTTEGGDVRAQSVELELPMCLFCTAVPPVKAAAYKITVAANRPPPQLTALFEDLIAQAGPGIGQAISSGSAGANVLSFQFYSGQDCTILVSKTGNKYRLQSDHLDAMWLILNELHRRLITYYAEADEGGRGEPLVLVFEDALPLEDFYEVVDHHFSCRLRASSLRKQLEDRAIQFRNVEKRLLMRFKDKNPSPLNQLDYLLDETYATIMETGQVLDNTQAQLTAAANKLACVVQLLLLLIRYRFNCSAEEFSVLKSYLSATVVDGPDVGWEECTEVSMLQLLRSCLSKSAKESAVAVPPLVPAKDTSKLKKHVGLVLERLARGMRMQLEPDDLAEGGRQGMGQGGKAVRASNSHSAAASTRSSQEAAAHSSRTSSADLGGM